MSIEFIPATCPKCGGELRVPNNLTIFKCMYCGVEIILDKKGNTEEDIKTRIQNYYEIAFTAQTARNYQESYELFSKILELDPNQSHAWIAKGFAAGMLSTINSLRFSEAIQYLEKGFPVNQINYYSLLDSETFIDEVFGGVEPYNQLREPSLRAHEFLGQVTWNWLLNVPKDYFVVDSHVETVWLWYEFRNTLCWSSLEFNMRAYGHYFPNKIIKDAVEQESFIPKIVKNIGFYFASYRERNEKGFKSPPSVSTSRTLVQALVTLLTHYKLINDSNIQQILNTAKEKNIPFDEFLY